ncbi:MAG: hypothetical protein IPL52_06960 [Flavobacteriales bacterium]|nr:hypothetical protein [Flavobacteriales bacterium]
MKRIVHILLLTALSPAALAQSYNLTLNALDPKEFGEPLKAELITPDMEKAQIPAIPVEMSVLLKKPIPMGCQYIYRITNKSTDRTVKLKMYTVPDAKFEEKIKPGESIELLTNTMMRCGATKEEKKERGCIDCQPSLNITGDRGEGGPGAGSSSRTRARALPNISFHLSLRNPTTAAAAPSAQARDAIVESHRTLA